MGVQGQEACLACLLLCPTVSALPTCYLPFSTSSARLSASNRVSRWQQEARGQGKARQGSATGWEVGVSGLEGLLVWGRGIF